jgi:cytochrome c peroxidase
MVARDGVRGRRGAAWVGVAALLGVLCCARAARADTVCDFVSPAGCSCNALRAGSQLPCPKSDADCKLALPPGFPCPNIADDNVPTTEKIELGRFLFYDTRMSGNQTQACASCHQQAKAFTDGRPNAIGSTGQMHPRSAMSLANVAYAGTLAWANPTLFTLENQAPVPMFGEVPVELGLSGKEDELFARLRADARYQRMFAEAFPGVDDAVSLDSITRALGSFERTLMSGNSAYDRYVFGAEDTYPAAAKRGELLFNDETRECFHCHAGFNFTTSVDSQGKIAEISFHNTGLFNLRCADVGLPSLDVLWCNPPPSVESCMQDNSSQPRGCQCEGSGPQEMGCYPPPNTGKYEVTHKADDMGAFKAPTLRNIAVTGPYMHDGSIATLEEVLDHYAAGGRTISEGPDAGVGSESPTKGQFVRGFPLTDTQKADIIEFLKTLTDDDFLTNPRFSDPFQSVRCAGDCNLDGTVDVSELVTSINVSLGSSSLAQCVVGDPSGDGAVTVDELIRAINAALNGCA